jgi:hypothetical protein
VPEIMQIEKTGQFRINRPADDWPDVTLQPRLSWIVPAKRTAVIERLRASATGKDPDAFEVAACDAFGLLNFVAEHIGGHGHADGVLMAPLGIDGYRAILECKTASPAGVVSNPSPDEAARFRAEHDAEYSILLGPAFQNEASLDDELRQHGVSLWTVDDLVTALEEEICPSEVRGLLKPGRVKSALEALLWERDHGRPKRVAVIADIIVRRGWEHQVGLIRSGVLPARSSPLTKEAIGILVEDGLMRAHVIGGPDFGEVEEALRRLEVSGAVRVVGAGYVVEWGGVSGC